MQPDLPSIDIITPIYNRSDFLLPLYTSIARHKLIKNWIIIDDGSDDFPCDVVHSLPKRFFKYHLRRIPKSGFNAALNAGFSHLVSDYFFKVDSDDLLSRNFTFFFKQVYYSLVRLELLPSIYGFSFRTQDSNGNLIGNFTAPIQFKVAHTPTIFSVIIPICAFIAIDRPVIS